MRSGLPPLSPPSSLPPRPFQSYTRGSTGVGGDGFTLRGAIVTQPVSILDLAATFVAVGGASKPRGMASLSLARVLTGDETPRDVRAVVTSALGGWKLAVTAVRVPESTGPVADLALPALVLPPGAAEGGSLGAAIPAVAADVTTRWVSARSNWSGARAPTFDKWGILAPHSNYPTKLHPHENALVDDQVTRAFH